MSTRSVALVLYAVVLVLCGTSLLIAPAETTALIGPAESTTPTLFVQLFGAALIGFAASNWIVRHAPMGGIYGRAVVFANQVFAVVGVLTLLGNLPMQPGMGFWGLLGVLAGGALLHGMLLFLAAPASKSTG